MIQKEIATRSLVLQRMLLTDGCPSITLINFILGGLVFFRPPSPPSDERCNIASILLNPSSTREEFSSYQMANLRC